MGFQVDYFYLKILSDSNLVIHFEVFLHILHPISFDETSNMNLISKNLAVNISIPFPLITLPTANLSTSTKQGFYWVLFSA